MEKGGYGYEYNNWGVVPMKNRDLGYTLQVLTPMKNRGSGLSVSIPNAACAFGPAAGDKVGFFELDRILTIMLLITFSIILY